jgi:hypothetical protein
VSERNWKGLIVETARTFSTVVDSEGRACVFIETDTSQIMLTSDQVANLIEMVDETRAMLIASESV